MSDEVPFSIRPGAVGPWRSVQVMLRQQHEQVQKQIAEAIAKRKQKGIPLDSLDDWRAQVGDLLDTFEQAKERSDAIALLEKAHAIANGGLQQLPDYEPVDAFNDIEVRFRSLSKGAVLEMQTALAGASAVRALDVGRAFLAKCLVGVRGCELEEGQLDVDNLKEGSATASLVLDLLDEAGLVPALFTCARAYQALSPLERRAFGSSEQSTCPRSSAPSALNTDGNISAAKAGEPLPTSRESSVSSQTVAHGGTSSTTTSSLPLSSFAVSSETRPA